MTRYTFNIPKAVYVNHEEDIRAFFKDLHNLNLDIDYSNSTMVQIHVSSTSDQIVLQCCYAFGRLTATF